MKKKTSISLILGSSILTCILIVAQGARSEDVQPQLEEPGTNVVAADVESDSLQGADDIPFEEGIMSQPSMLPDGIDPNSPLAELARMVQAGVEQSVMLVYIANSPRIFNLDADDIIYLNDIGTPAEVIEAIIEHDQTLIQKGIAPVEPRTEPSNEPTPEPPVEVTDNYFYDTLSPYGAWVYIDGYGRCWRPTVVVHNSSWRPYCDNGRWVYTDHGWYWYSGYSWGSTTFHYGRWFKHSRYGWCWWPDRVWSPSWVYWRYNSDYCGWAPLPPHTTYRSGVGFVYRGSRVSVGFDFGLGANTFTFVSIRNFCGPTPWRYRVRDRDVSRIYNRTVVCQNINYDRNNRTMVNSGIPKTHITSITHQEINPVSVRYNRGRQEQGGRGERLDRNARVMHVNRPVMSDSEDSTPLQGQNPGSVRRRQGTFQSAEVGGAINSTLPQSNRSGATTDRSGVQSFNTRQPNGGSRGNSSHVESQSSQSDRVYVPSTTTTRPQSRNSSMDQPSSNSGGTTANRGGGIGNRTVNPQSRRTQPVSSGAGSQASTAQGTAGGEPQARTPSERKNVTPSRRRNIPNHTSGTRSSASSARATTPPRGTNNSGSNSSRQSGHKTQSTDDGQQ